MIAHIIRQHLLLLLLSIKLSALGTVVELIPVCDDPYGTVVKEIDLAEHGDSALRCAIECRAHPTCASIVVSQEGSWCRLNDAKRESWPACGTPNATYANMSPLSTMGEACTSTASCIDDQSVCRDDMCRCLPGLSFDAGTNACVENCPGEYGDTFQADLGHVIWGFLNDVISGLTEAGCKEACVNVTGYVCRHAEFWISGSTCYLSEDTIITAEAVTPGSYRIDPTYNLYFRDCK